MHNLVLEKFEFPSVSHTKEVLFQIELGTSEATLPLTLLRRCFIRYEVIASIMPITNPLVMQVIQERF